jgi:hypothetical protein
LGTNQDENIIIFPISSYDKASDKYKIEKEFNPTNIF